MTRRPRPLLTRPAAAAAALLLCSWVSAAAQQTGAPSPAQNSGQRYKNIMVFNELPAGDLHDAMVYMGAALAGNCSTCHVRGADGEMAFDKDDNDHKGAARDMIRMVRAINGQYFKGEDLVTCATCHQARHTPNALPPLSQPLSAEQLALMGERGRQGGAPPGAPAQPGAQPGGQPPPGGRGTQRPTETVDQVLDKYLEALGGRPALSRLTSRVRRGTLTNRAGQASAITIEETAAGLVRTSLVGPPAITRAYDGSSAWVDFGGRGRDLEGIEATNAGLGADLLLGTQIKEKYAALAVRAYDRVNGKPVLVLEGRAPGSRSETLYFDRATGLLVRRSVRLKTPLGALPVQFDYDDYRPVDGVQTPFEVRVTDWESVSVEKFSDVVHNQPIDASRFARPVAAPGR